MELGIQGRRAIVCASSMGLGRACATSLARAGVAVTINARNAERLAQTADEIAQAIPGASINTVAADVTTPEGQAALFEACPAPDILITNAGGPPFKHFSELNRDELIDGVKMNMITPIELVQRAIGGMVDRKFGRIVNITSVSVKMPISGLDLSSGARAGLTAFLAGVARDVAPSNVAINNLLPGYFDTDRFRSGLSAWANSQGSSEKAVRDARSREVPARRIGDPEEFGNVCAFLCSSSAGYLVGQNILLDGGLYPSAF
ncbi:MAG: SDR family oxidoreductase [Burkholderiaceae bacterium]